MAKFISLLMVLYVLFYVPVSAAFDCFQSSPNLVILGDDYWKDKGLVDVEEDEVALSWLKDLQGDWEGEVIEKGCKGSDAHPRQVLTQGIAKVTITESGSVLLSLDIEKNYVEEKITKTERIALLDKERLFALKVQDQQLDASERRRQAFYRPDKTKSARYIEKISHIQLENNTLEITWSFFINGVYTFTQTLRLQQVK